MSDMVLKSHSSHDAIADVSLMTTVDAYRVTATRKLNPARRSEMGQFLTPAPIATFMASLFENRNTTIRLLDPGAGIGSLSAAFVMEMCQRTRKPRRIELTAYELDSILIEHLEDTLQECRSECHKAGVEFEARVVQEDFIAAGAHMLAGDLLSLGTAQLFDCAILNPPYRKIQTGSDERKFLRKAGIETSNLYAGFLGIAVKLLAPGGEVVAITPRSFCNGPYFRRFRELLLDAVRIRRVHIFESRDTAFSDDEVLQENIIIHADTKTKAHDLVNVSISDGPREFSRDMRTIEYEQLVHPGDPDAFIHIVPNGDGDDIRKTMERMAASLTTLGITVSTGRVVDFRATELLRAEPEHGSAPLIYPGHLGDGYVNWPKTGSKKPNALSLGPGSAELLVPAGYYVLVKRFSAKEETRRVVAAVYDPKRICAERVAFENHLNYFHRKGEGLPESLAKGLSAYLNSSFVDAYFRQFSGHTQVNATDLRSLRYPDEPRLIALGERIGSCFPEQGELDRLIDEVILDA